MQVTKYLYAGRNNVGRRLDANSVMENGDSPTLSREPDDLRPQSVECELHPDGDLYDGVSMSADMYSDTDHY